MKRSDGIIISFIVPIFNAELYIEDCLDSIISQNLFCDCELICVDDKSTDRSCEIIERYEERYPNIRLIKHNENKKAGGARNTGIQAAAGKYIWFVDSDDTIVIGALGKIIAQLQENDLDVFCFNVSLAYDSSQQICNIFKESSVMSGYRFIKRQWGQNPINYLGYPYIAVFRKSIVSKKNISFIENTTYGEDTTFITEIIAESNRVASTSESLYNYRQGHTSLTSLLEKSWKGAQVYESIFTAGNLVVNNIIERHRDRNPEFCSNIEDGMPWFANRLFLRLIRCSRKERKIFFLIIHNRAESTKEVLKYMNVLNKFIIMRPYAAYIVLNILSPVYKIHSEKKKRLCF